MNGRQGLDIRPAQMDPRSEFGTPEMVLADRRFGRETKRAILRSWEQDERQMARAEEEGLAGGSRSMLRRVLRALDTLSDHPESRPPSETASTTRLVADVMHPCTEVIHVDHDLREACVRMRTLHMPCLPVTDGDEIVGTLSARDIYGTPHATEADFKNARVGDYLPRGVAFCYFDDDVETALAAMDRSGHRHLVVVDEERYLLGLVTLDVITAALRVDGPSHMSGPDASPERRVVEKAGRATAEQAGRQRVYAVRPKVRR